MSRRESEEDDAAPPPPSLTTPTKVSRNDGACHAVSDAEGSENESDADVEEKFDESTGNTRKYNSYLQYTEVKRWKTCPGFLLDPAQINYEMFTLMKKFYAAEPLDAGSGTRGASDRRWPLEAAAHSIL
jgi:hypothetical protein